MAIEWGTTGFSSFMGSTVLDNTGLAPTDVLEAGVPFKIEIKWDIPPALVPLMNPAGDAFRLRAFAESIGPGQEMQIGATAVVTAVAGAPNYTFIMDVNPNPLVGEGGVFGGVPVSGVYTIVVVLQHLSSGAATVISGFSEFPKTVMFKLP